MITFSGKGDFSKTFHFLEKAKKIDLTLLDKYGKAGVNVLSSSTPEDTGKTASSWSYEIVRKGNYITISWHNSNIVDGVNIAIILQYGHGTRNGGWVEGRDYINPAIQPIFDEFSRAAWEEVIK